jgi:hypothetical protein
VLITRGVKLLVYSLKELIAITQDMSFINYPIINIITFVCLASDQNASGTDLYLYTFSEKKDEEIKK